MGNILRFILDSRPAPQNYNPTFFPETNIYKWSSYSDGCSDLLRTGTVDEIGWGRVVINWVDWLIDLFVLSICIKMECGNNISKCLDIY